MKGVILILVFSMFNFCFEGHADDATTNSSTNESPKGAEGDVEKDPYGLKAYDRFLSDLAKKAKKPDKESKFLGKWIDARGDAAYYILSEDGTFTYNFGHTKGKGEWRQSDKSVILLCYDAWRSKGGTFEAHKLVYIKDGVLKTDELDYTNDYVRESKEGESPRRETQSDNKAQ